MNNFYVYAYLRSKSSANGEAGTPYYIGKGTGRRMFERHVVKVPNDRSNIKVLFEGLSNEEAIAKEIELIAKHGRLDIRTGILRNRTNGGEGGSPGRIVAESQRLKSSKSNRGQTRSAKARENIKKGLTNVDLSGENNHFYGTQHTPEARQKMSAAKKGKSFEEIYGKEQANKKRKTVSEKLRGRTFTEESIAKMKKPKGPQAKVLCPYCGKEGGVSNMKRWHFKNCKSFSNEDTHLA